MSNRLGSKLVLLSLLCASRLANAGPWGYTDQALSAYFEGGYYSTTQNYDPNGNLLPLPGTNQFNEITMDLSARYDFSNSFSMWGGGVFKRVDSTTSIVERTNLNPTDVSLGGDFRLFSWFVDVIPELSVDFPLYAPPGSASGSVLLGDGAIVGTAKVNVTRHFKGAGAGLSAYAGYTYRSQGLSSQIPFGLALHIPWKTLFFQAKFYGATTASGDQYYAQPLVRYAVTNSFDGGSLIYNSINPTFINGQGSVGWYFSSRFYVKATVDQIFAGQDTSQGTRYLFGFGYTEETSVEERHAEDIDAQSFEVDTKEEEIPSPQQKGSTPRKAPPGR